MYLSCPQQQRQQPLLRLRPAAAVHSSSIRGFRLHPGAGEVLLHLDSGQQHRDVVLFAASETHHAGRMRVLGEWGQKVWVLLQWKKKVWEVEMRQNLTDVSKGVPD